MGLRFWGPLGSAATAEVSSHVTAPPRSPAPPPRGPYPPRPADPPREGASPVARRTRRQRRPRWALRCAAALSLAVLAAAGVGHTVVTGLDTGIRRVDAFKDMKNRPEGGHGMNVLLVGTDGRDKISRAERKKYRLGGEPCHCTDTIMIVHISADRNRASVVSLPRDSYAELPEHVDRNSRKKHRPHPVKINAAYAEGGPNLTVRTVERMTKVKIDHYLEVDFTSFMKTVDVLGGVEICTTRPLKDAYTGLDLPVGSHQLNGGQALQYVRSRHIDGAADLGRMQRQQRFLAALIAKATSSGVLLNPVKFRDVTQTLLGSVRADKGFGTEDMLALGRAMRDFSPSSSEFTTVPLDREGRLVAGVGETLRWHPKKAPKLFQALRDDKPLAPHRERRKAVLVPVSPGLIQVQVDNGTRTPGLARRVDGALGKIGFRTTGAPGTLPLAPGAKPLARTVVAYDPRWDRSAKSLATALPGCEMRQVPGQGAVLKVLAGSDFRQVRRVRAEDAFQGEFGVVTGDEVVCR
ncbi:LytR family transcriptional regulator [Streptomyces longispororuber]|uniref:LytR family transcriptional regulator n=1 Tax=Streptomyces longispororuber TaxID=68230 RepID=A0A918ZNH1_9ACTN|nr:LCP family protein [Streptomyces longispororuber]GHE61562.1 LytR family transcriptional regulator [Streptomyces longispororuber]